MQIDWTDVVKLTVPFVTAILMVWIKAWIEVTLARRNKQHALSRLISDELGHLQETISTLKQIAESAKEGNLRLVSIDISNLMSKFASDLADLDAKQAYSYSDLVSSAEIVNKGLLKLSSLVLPRTGAGDPAICARIDRAIIGQSKITAIDFIAFAKAGIKVAKIIPEGIRYTDSQALNTLDQAVDSAEKSIEEWPTPPPAVRAQQGAPGDSASLRA